MKLFKILLIINLIIYCGVLYQLLHLNTSERQTEGSEAILEVVEEPVIAQKIDNVKLLAKAIEKFEGNYAGSVSQRNNNPGNLKGAPTQAGKRDGFAFFKTYEDGFRALESHIERAALGEIRYYKKGITLERYFHIYAPVTDDNQPNVYFEFVIKETGFDRNILLLDLL